MVTAKTILLTGGAGFIGAHVCRALLQKGYGVIVLDNLDPFYDPAIKRMNLAELASYPAFQFIDGDIREKEWEQQISRKPDALIHLAAKAGVRPSIENPKEYLEVNIQGTLNVLEYAREQGISRLLFGSSSSVYGLNPQVPWKETDTDLRPISPYAQSKLAAEQLCRVYSYLYGMDIKVLRFFTVYGPGQRPDLAIHGFFKKILAGVPIPQYGDGTTARDYTYVGDIVKGVLGALEIEEYNGFQVYNLGNSQTIRLSALIRAIEETMGLKAIIDYLPEQPGDVPVTSADITKSMRELNYQPATTLNEGLASFWNWMKVDKGAQLLK